MLLKNLLPKTLLVFVESVLKGSGKGPSKQIAQQKAAEAALATYVKS